MAEVLRYVNISPTNTPGGDGTTNAVTGANRAYATLSEWEAAEQTDLVADGDTHRVLCSNTGGGNSDTAQCIIDGWTTGASNGITVEQNPTDRTFGVLDTSKYKMRSALADGLIDIRQDYVDVKYVQFERSQLGTSSGDRRALSITSDAGGAITLDGLVIVNVDTTSTGSGLLTGILYTSSNNDTLTTNCSVYDFDHPTKSYKGVEKTSSAGTNVVSNCTLQNNDTHLVHSGVSGLIAKNNVLQDAVTADVSGTLDSSSDYNLTDKGSFPTGSNNVLNSTLTFADKANDDFHLDSGDTDAIGAGIGPGSDSDIPTVDVDGDIRSGSSTDIGYDLAPSTANTIPSIAYNYRRRR